MNGQFWFFAGILTGFAATLLLVPLWRGAAKAFANRLIRVGAAAVGVVLFAGAALALYWTFGRPDLLTAHAKSSALSHAGLSVATSGQSADSMESAIAGLEARIARGGGNREDWLLLAQSYEFVGRTGDAERARKRADAPPNAAADRPPPAAAAAPSLTELERKAHANPKDVDAWRALAALYRRQHAPKQAHDAFVHLEQLGAMTADTWADDADVLASLAGGSLRADAARAIDRALALDAAHAKALWLKASLAHEEHRYADALRVWRRLRAVLPPESPDIRVVDANIEEATELAGSTPSLPQGTEVAFTPVNAEVSGTVSIDGRLASRVTPGATLFIYAKAVDSPGPPLAVLRQSAGAWPVTFRLDDTLAMIPTRKLSQFERVVIEARISSTGQATPTTGDLYVTSAVLKPADRKKIQLVIDHEAG